MTFDTPAAKENDSSGRDLEQVAHEAEEVLVGEEPGRVSFREAEGTGPRRNKRPSMYVASESFMDDSQPHLFEESYHPRILRAYNPPKQRQRWGDKRVLPRVNWGDLFFDLFYVAATYNISYILVDYPSGLGFLYFISTFLAVMYLWSAKTFYDSCFVIDDDIYHRVFEVLFLTALASSIVHIRTVDILSHPSDYIDMFVLSLSLLVGIFITLIRQVEVGVTGVGQPDLLKQVSIRNTIDVMITFSLQLAATIIAGLDYYRHADGSHRLLAGEASGSTNHLPIILTIAGPVIFQIVWFVRGIFFFPSDGSHTKKIVPMNVDFNIHRNAEWTMLMLGESVFSLLVEEISESSGFYSTFYCGLITVIFLEYIHFTSQPMVAERHAMVESKNRAIMLATVLNFYSASLVGLGAGLTLFLRTFAKSGNGERRLWLEFAFEGRWLAGGGEPAFPPDELKQRAATVFSISLGLVLFCVELMTFFHVGLDKVRAMLRSKSTMIQYAIIVLVVVRLGLILFVATLCQWNTDPQVLSGIGLASVLMYSVLFSVPRKLAKDDNQKGHGS